MDLTDHQREQLKFATEDWQDNGDGAFVDLLGDIATRDTELGALILDYIEQSRALAEDATWTDDEQPVTADEWVEDEPMAEGVATVELRNVAPPIDRVSQYPEDFDDDQPVGIRGALRYPSDIARAREPERGWADDETARDREV